MLAALIRQMALDVNARQDSLVHCVKITSMIVQRITYVKMMQPVLMEIKILVADASQDMQEEGNIHTCTTVHKCTANMHICA